MSMNASADVFPFKVAGHTTVMDQEEFHDIEVNSIDSGHKIHDSESSISPICLVIKAESG